MNLAFFKFGCQVFCPINEKKVTKTYAYSSKLIAGNTDLLSTSRTAQKLKTNSNMN